MIRLVTFLVAVCLSYLSTAQEASKENQADTIAGTRIKATVTNVLSKGGEVIFVLYDSATNFKSQKPKATKKVVPAEGKATAVFENIEQGTYAIMALHDMNANNRMDFDEGGMTKEYYGASNNVMRMGPPSFEDAKFTVENKSVTLEIRF